MKGIPVQVLFDSGATRSFVSLALSKRFIESSGMLDCPLEVEIADDRSVRASAVFRGCVLMLFEERYLVDLVPIPLRGNKVIIGMDWLSPNGAVIDCAHQLVRIRIPSGGELVIHGERPQRGPAVCSTARARRYLQQGCTGYVAYVMDTQETGKATVSEVPVVRDYADVFPEELPGIPPERQVEFRIDLVPGATPIAKAPYRLAPPEMQELSTQLQELLDKGFI